MRFLAFTSSRADYGHMLPVLREMRSRGHEVELAAAGAHLSNMHGHTVDSVEEDDWHIYQVHSAPVSDARFDTVISATRVGQGLGKVLELKNWDALIVLGDRFETFAAVSTAFLMNVPVIHFHGGETIQGVFDDGLRHAISKLSAMHFVAHEEFADRLIRMGEEPWRVHVVGAVGNIDLDVDLEYATRVLTECGVADHHYAMVVLHTETTGTGNLTIRTTIDALKTFKDLHFVVVDTNVDPGGYAAMQILHSMKSNKRWHYVSGLPRKEYAALLKYSVMIVGNSSSGLIEAPLLGVPTVDVGLRQAGRSGCSTVIRSSANTVTHVVRACETALRIPRDAPLIGHMWPSGEPVEVVDLIETNFERVCAYKKFFDGEGYLTNAEDSIRWHS